MCPIQLTFLLLIVCRICLSPLTIRNTSTFLTSLVLLHRRISKVPKVFKLYMLFKFIEGLNGDTEIT